VTDASSTMASLELQLSEANQQRDVLQGRINALLMEVEFLRKHRTLRDAIAGEAIICELVDGVTTPSGFPHDVVKGKITIEVKFANLNNTSSPSGNYTRWAWGKIFGEGGNKEYDYLLLVGVKDLRWIEWYKGKSGPYVFFCVPHEEVASLTQPMNGNKYRAIQLPSNPRRVRRSRAARLYSDFEMTYEELRNKFILFE
jgi:hypothetical protein